MNKWFQLAVYALMGLIITSFALNLLQGIGAQNTGGYYYYGPGMGNHRGPHMGIQNNNQYNNQY